MDIDIELLQLTIDDASGHEHRIRPIAARAAEILAMRLHERQERGDDCRARHASPMKPDPIRLDLSRMSNERAALSVAAAWMEALTVKMEAGG